MSDYVIGYGSLINEESRQITGLTARAYPVWLSNYERTWSASFPELSFCALSALPQPEKKMNAVLFEVLDMPAFDEREMGYIRKKVESSLVQAYFENEKLPELSHCWIYIPKNEILSEPSEKNIIWQSYLDVCLSGCLKIGEAFAHDFIKSTKGWNTEFWADDRGQNEYLKALKNFSPDKVDSILKLNNLHPEMSDFDDSALRNHVRKRLS